MIQTVAYGVVAASFLFFLYTYFGYPGLLWVWARVRGQPLLPAADGELPPISICIPAYNEETQIRDLLESLLALDYPRDRLQVLVVSDASTDRTDEIVREYADRGVQLHRMPERGGKTKIESAAAKHLTGDIIVNTDASIWILPDAPTIPETAVSRSRMAIS